MKMYRKKRLVGFTFMLIKKTAIEVDIKGNECLQTPVEGSSKILVSRCWGLDYTGWRNMRSDDMVIEFRECTIQGRL